MTSKSNLHEGSFGTLKFVESKEGCVNIWNLNPL